MICKTPDELRTALAAPGSIISIRADLIETIVGDKEIGTDDVSQSIARSRTYFAGTRHALRVGRVVAERLAEIAGPSIATPRITGEDEEVDDEDDDEVDDEDDDSIL